MQERRKRFFLEPGGLLQKPVIPAGDQIHEQWSRDNPEEKQNDDSVQIEEQIEKSLNAGMRDISGNQPVRQSQKQGVDSFPESVEQNCQQQEQNQKPDEEGLRQFGRMQKCILRTVFLQNHEMNREDSFRDQNGKTGNSDIINSSCNRIAHEVDGIDIRNIEAFGERDREADICQRDAECDSQKNQKTGRSEELRQEFQAMHAGSQDAFFLTMNLQIRDADQSSDIKTDIQSTCQDAQC